MRQHHHRFAFAVAALAGLAGGALAMEPEMPRSQRAFDRLDADHNGAISLAELQPKAQRRFLRLDGDSNGEVTTAEIDAALQKGLERRRNRILGMLDADANGTVTTAELDAFVEAMVNGADANADGGVSIEEARNFRLAKLRKPTTGGGTN